MNRRVWLIEKAASPAALPEYLTEREGEVLGWTTRFAEALRFTDEDLGTRFAQHRVTEPVCLVDVVID